MSHWTATGRRIIIAGTALCLAAFSHAQEIPQTATGSVPTYLVEAAERAGSPELFVRALARMAVPAVVVLGPQHPDSRPIDVGALEHLSGKSYTWAVARFTERHPSYELTTTDDGVAVIVPVRTACRAALHRVISMKGRGRVSDVLFQLARTIDPSLPDVPPGIVSGGGAGDTSAAWSRIIDIDTRGQTVLGTLATLAIASPGVVWAVKEQAAQNAGAAGSRCTLALLTGELTLATSYDLR